MTRRPTDRRLESGQAFTELALLLIALAAAALGMLFVSALCLQDNRALLSARENADRNAGSAAAVSPPNEIRTWRYAPADGITGESGLHIPFTFRDVPVYGGAAAAGIANRMNSAADSNGGTLYHYRRLRPSDLNQAQFADDGWNITNAADAAGLAEGTPYEDDTVERFTAGYSGGKSAAMRGAFRKLFSAEVEKNIISESISNRVYMPKRRK